jgi:Carboxypeptidase regulatory-like domain
VKHIAALSGRALVALICSLLILFQPVFGAQEAVTSASALPLLSGAAAEPAPELIAVAKLSGTADRNGEPLANGSVIASGDSLSTHGNSAVLLASTPEERLWLGANTDVKLSKDGSTVNVVMVHGTVTFRSHGHVQITVENHDAAVLRSTSNGPVLAQVSLIGGEQAQVRVKEGSLELVEGGRTMLLQPERAGRLSPSSASRLDGSVAKGDGEDAQTTSASTGAVNGTVVDAGLFVVTDAQVTLTSDTGKVFTATTGQDGKFTFLNLQPGSYTLHVTKSGFKPYDLKDVTVRSGNESSLFVHLGSGSGAAGTGGSNKTLLWVLIGGAGAAAGIGAALASHGSSTSNTSPSTTQ